MQTVNANYWDPNLLLSDTHNELEIPISAISIPTSILSDYAFTNEEINLAADQLQHVGITQRLVIETSGDSYILLGPILPYLALQTLGTDRVSCIVRSDTILQVQQLLSMQLNAQYCTLSPLVYARLIAHLQRIYPIIRTISGVNPGIKRKWIAGILGISSSAVLRYSYINKVPAALQLRCNNRNFPYLCYKDATHFNNSQFNELLEELIHYELHSRYQTISSAELSAMIHSIDNHPTDLPDTIAEPVHTNVQLGQMASLYDPMTERYYDNLRASYEDRFDDEVEAGSASLLADIARKDGYFVPDQMLRDISYQLYCLSRVRMTEGQRLMNYACLRSILDSVSELYSSLYKS